MLIILLRERKEVESLSIAIGISIILARIARRAVVVTVVTLNPKPWSHTNRASSACEALLGPFSLHFACISDNADVAPEQ